MANPPDQLRGLFLLSDEPIDGETPDDLGRESDARVLAELVLGSRGPFTIGVFGDWGTGKTSLLNQIRRHLSAKDASDPTGHRYPYVIPVFFNAWQFEREKEPIAHLAGAIHDAVSRRLKEARTWSDEAKVTAVRWLRSVHTASRAAVYAISLDAGGAIKDAAPPSLLGILLKSLLSLRFSPKDTIDRYEKLQAQQADPNSKVWQQHINESVTMATLRSLRADDELLGDVRPGSERRTPRVVVFLDDLDRCSAAGAFRILQDLKLALGQPGFVFVLSLNPDTLRPFIAQQSKDAGRGDKDGAETIYLDKLVQLVYPLRLRDEQFTKFCRTLVEERLKDVVSAAEHEAFVKLRPALRDSSGRNPRTLKRRVNALIIDARLAPSTLLERLNSDTELARAEFLGLCLLDQTARHMGAASHLDELGRHDDLCKEIASSGFEALIKALRDLKRGVTSPPGGATMPSPTFAPGTIQSLLVVHESLLERLWAAPTVAMLLDYDFAKHWLTNATLRREFAQFVTVRPDDTTREPGSGAAGTTPITKTLGRESDPTTAKSQTSASRPPVVPAAPPLVPASVSQVQSRQKVSRPRSGAYFGTPPTVPMPDAERTLIERAVRKSLGLDDDVDLRPGHFVTVVRLNFSNEPLTDAGMAWLAMPDPGLHALNLLDLNDTNVTDSGLVALARPDSGLRALTSLRLTRTKVTDAGLAVLARPDSGLKALTRLDLRGTQVTDAGLRALARPDSVLRELTSLCLASTRITDAGLESLLQRDSGLKALTLLYLSNTAVTNTSRAAVRRRFPGITVF